MATEGVCPECGAVGWKPYGPFYTSVQKRWRETVEAHVAARHEVFLHVDRCVAGQLIKLLKSDLTSEDILVEAHAGLEKGMKFWSEGKPNEAIALVLSTVTRLLYVLECVEVSKSKPSSQ